MSAVTFLQVRCPLGCVRQQRFEHLSTDQQAAVALYLNGDTLSPEQQSIIDSMGTILHVMGPDPADGEFVTHELQTGRIRKRGTAWQGTSPVAEVIAKAKPPPGKKPKEPKPKGGRLSA